MQLVQREKPILFSTPMVIEVSEGRKTKTRRVAKEPIKIRLLKRVEADILFLAPGCWANPGVYKAELNQYGAVSIETPGGNLGIKPTEFEFLSPIMPGDIMWVRETWFEFPKNIFHYRADEGTGRDEMYFSYPPRGWRSSRYMPKVACRHWLRCTDRRLERLQDISERDAIAEGCPRCIGLSECGGGCDACEANHPIKWFHRLWDSLNAKRGHGWDKNDWVWVYTFKKIAKPEGWPGVVS